MREPSDSDDERASAIPVPRHARRARELPSGAVLLAFDLAPVMSAPLQRLTPGQARVARLALEGLGDQAIAQQLGLSRHTVANHLRRGYARLGVSTRAELAALACDAATRADED
jgi:DNA-binding CsgD family transcriptional regulator